MAFVFQEVGRVIKAAVVGASGYAGAELLRLLAHHPRIEVAAATAGQYAGQDIASLYPSLSAVYKGSFVSYTKRVLEDCDIVFCGLPHGESAGVVKESFEMGKKVVDLSADFRLSAQDYEKWYGLAHPCPELLAQAAYGLPELYRGLVASSSIIANPGCYPTSALLGLAPLAKAGLLAGTVIIDSKSGVSGAGRSLSLATHFPQVADGISPYAVKGHRHEPEMSNGLAGLSGEDVGVVFTPHLVPMNRGILSTMYVRLGEGAGLEDARALCEKAYEGEQFVQVLPQGAYPNTKSVQGSNCCQVSLEMPRGSDTLIIMSVIDNLVKGASGQAVQNANLVCGLEEGIGLANVGLFP